MPYELNINAGVQGQQNVDQLGNSLNTVAGRAQYLDEKIAHMVGSNALLVKGLDLQKEILGTLRSQLDLMVSSVTKGTSAVDSHTQSVTRMTAAHAASVSQVQAVGGALRTLEGAMPIRAAERFLTLLPGVGAALQAAFPLFGLVAFGEVLGRMVGEIVKLADSWDTVLQAQRESNKLLENGVKLVAEQSRALRDAQIANIGLTQGPGAAARARAGDLSAQAQFSDEERVRRLQLQVTALQAIISHRPGFMSPAELSALEEVSNKMQAAGGKDAARISFGLQDPRLAPGFLASPASVEAANKALTPIAEELKAAQERQQADILKARNENLQATKDDEKQARRDDVADLRVQHERAAELKKDWEAIEKSVKEAAKDFDIMIGPLTPGGSRFVPSEHFMNEFSEAPRIRENTEREFKQAVESLYIGSGRNRVLSPEFFGEIAAPEDPGIRLAQQQALQRQLGLLGTNARLSGMNPVDEINARYNLELKVADLEKDVAKAEQERYKAAIEREKDLLQLEQERQKRLKDDFTSGAVGLIDAARTGHAGTFIRGQLNQRLDEILGRIIGDIAGKIGIGKGPAGVSIPDVLGGALKTATDQNTVATEDNTDALKDLTVILRSRAGSVPGPGGIGTNPGWSPSWGGSNGPFVLNGFPGMGGGFPGLGPLYGFPGSGAPPMGGGGMSGLNIGGIPLGSIAMGGAGLYGLISGIQQGGARGGLQAGAGAAALASLIPGVGAVALPVAAGLEMISALLGDPKKNRSNQIFNQLQASQFMAPPSLNVMESTGGQLFDFDRLGNIRTSNLSPFPQVQNGFFTPARGQTAPGQQGWVPVPGRILNNFGGPTGSGTTNVTIQAMDGTDVARVLNRNASVLGDAISRGFDTGAFGDHVAQSVRRQVVAGG